ncbi:Hypothetical predicted protein [Xyrichtys novacula]|uniref:Uncharacterized protein n=1 Tax=Xyrichtys novacula TaxID=13765 RepID=A0AAV1H9L1_XYRNO|nr:Hypothetical predicted protein [Xyrichtys novacula]
MGDALCLGFSVLQRCTPAGAAGGNTLYDCMSVYERNGERRDYVRVLICHESIFSTSWRETEHTLRLGCVTQPGLFIESCYSPKPEPEKPVSNPRINLLWTSSLSGKDPRM